MSDEKILDISWKTILKISVAFVYVGIFGIFSFLVFLVVPIFTSEIREFLQSFPHYFEKISPPLRGLGFQAFENIESFLEALGNGLEKMAGSIFSAFFAIFGGGFSAFFVIITA